MNFLEHIQLLSEDFDGIRVGKVIKNDDPSDKRRVKVRVTGVFDAPISKEHIPWAIPIVECRVPVLGEYVGIIFIDSDIMRPLYFTSGSIEDGQFESLKALYRSMIDLRENSRKINISVLGDTFTEPSVGASDKLHYTKELALIPEDVATETSEGFKEGNPSKAMVIEKDMESGKERAGFMHPSGTFAEFNKDGDLDIHVVGDDYSIVEGSKNVSIGGKARIKIGQVQVLIEQSGNVTVDSGSGKIQFKGAQFEVDGTVVPDGTGPFCGLAVDPFTGAPQTGKISVAN